LQHSKRILIAPLDWGLGHTTRCVPLINYLKSEGHHPILAGNNLQLSFFKKYFPSAETVYLDGYNVRYPHHASLLLLHLFLQTPAILKKIEQENQWLQQFIKTYSIDAVISDNRYGLYHQNIPSVIITHQLQPSVPHFLRNGVRKLHYHFLEKFEDCWVPDIAEENNLAGSLTHPEYMPHKTKYIGWLSHLFPPKNQEESNKHLLVLLSGLEPMRSQLSALLWQQIQHYEGQVVFIEGSKSVVRKCTANHIQWQAQLQSEELKKLMQEAEIVICRSGYSSVMDLVTLQKKAILIPTPGQTEQEYLATYLQQKEIFPCCSQNEFQLKRALNLSKDFPFKQRFSKECFLLHQQVLTEWLKSF